MKQVEAEMSDVRPDLKTESKIFVFHRNLFGLYALAKLNADPCAKSMDEINHKLYFVCYSII